MENQNYTFDGQPIFLLGERACGVRGFNNVQDFYAIRKECLESGTLFEDPEFPPTGVWLRPNEICENPQFLVNKISRFDVKQGRIADSWFLSAIASLTLNEQFFYRVVCDDNSFEQNYAGIFHFRFWQYGQWVDVVIDDRLPTNGGQLLYLNLTQRNEFWSALLEKAYAKLYGSYTTLNVGMSCEAFGVFTGGFPEIYNLKSAPSNLYDIMEKAYNRNSMMSCLTKDGPSVAAEALVRITAYSITKVKSFENSNNRKKSYLLQLKNPLGNETNSAWSDKSEEWKLISESEKKEIGLTINNDGEFWMTYQNFLKRFDRLDICNLSPESLEVDKCNLNLFEGQWVKGLSAGGCANNEETFHLNPQFIISHENADDEKGLCSVTITLTQKNRRTRGSVIPQLLVIGFTIYPVSELQLKQKPLKEEFFHTTRRCQASKFTNSYSITDCYNFSTGHYVIVPSTFDPNEEGEFLIRVYSESKHAFVEHDKTVEIRKIDPKVAEEQKVEKLFKDAADSNGKLGWAELKTILDSSIPKVIQQSGTSPGFSREDCRLLLAMMDSDFSRNLKLDEFKKFYGDYKLWKSAFKTFDTDGCHELKPLQFRDALESVGYSFGARIINKLIYRYGNENNSVPYEDFIMCAVKIKTTVDRFEKKSEIQAEFTLEEWIMTTLYS